MPNEPEYIHRSRLENLEHALSFLSAQVGRLTEGVERLVRVEERLDAMKEHNSEVIEGLKTSLEKLEKKADATERKLVVWMSIGYVLAGIAAFIGPERLEIIIRALLQ